ncbi:hypothetical protein HN51_004865 [Arachis hypogaea]|uniref:Leucine-rich repeat-containing N-terminal plant-type domain-containing protein n=2 Tax=Arachis TaxID=3817 RepID=A0A445DGS9_ARAHY|nr:uncharacterized protein At4g06744 [Arachis duranensis]XP_025695156.1 uncharacterized protein At4g06744 [Arachis hypogaea]QHO38522.1 uncharacterized protein DS421_4g121120 [Arachis hypogaea]RYR62374.1 hypothetical protein Ahy_A04g019895 [Arachis hypogaea]
MENSSGISTTLFITFLLLIPSCCVIFVNCKTLESSSLSLDLTIPDILGFLDERLALIFPIIQAFKTTITSDPLGITSTWSGPNICNYTGFYCDNPPDNKTAVTVASIDFNGFQLSAPSLDGFIDQLSDLAIFHANSNNFSGTISPNVAKLKFLYELDLSNNLLSGVFPVSVLNMPTLSFLDIRYNLFSGTVPPSIFTQALDVLFLNNNNFALTLPNNLGDTKALYLTLANNKFTGPIPRSIRKASATLTEVLFLNNLLTGCLPYEIGFLKKATLFDAGNNLLTGPLPSSLGCLESVEQLNLARNQLYGQIPEVVCALGNLANLSLSYNYFTKVGPLCRNMIKKGVADVRKNCISGLPNQRSAQECFAFFLSRRSCGNPAWFNFLPCKIPPWKKPNSESNSTVTTTTKRNLLSYSAPFRNRLLL